MTRLLKRGEGLYLGGFGIKDHPVGSGHPVSQHHQARLPYGHVYAAVIMAKDEEIHRRMLEIVLAILIQRLIRSLEMIGDGLFSAGLAAPALSQTESKPGMQGRKERL